MVMLKAVKETLQRGRSAFPEQRQQDSPLLLHVLRARGTGNRADIYGGKPNSSTPGNRTC